MRADAGRIHDALRGYREVIDYFARTGNWTHQWTTLRNLADLLRRLGDDEPAALLDAAADQAPDAPAVDGARAPATAETEIPAGPPCSTSRGGPSSATSRRRSTNPSSLTHAVYVSTPIAAMSPVVCVSCAASARTLRSTVSASSTRSTASRSSGTVTG